MKGRKTVLRLSRDNRRMLLLNRKSEETAEEIRRSEWKGGIECGIIVSGVPDFRQDQDQE